MLEQLRTFQRFRSLDSAALAAVERHADRLRLPEQRWLRRRGQPLTRELFLVDGTVAVRDGNNLRRISARQTRGESLNDLIGEGAEISTASAVEVIAVDLASVQPLLEVSAVDGWIDAFLEGPVMKWFPPRTWARLLRAGEARRVRQGDLVVAKGETSAHIFVVGEGTARSRERRFGAGDFFAEESALMGIPATADILMETDGVLFAFAPRDVLALIGEYDAQAPDPPQRVDLDSVSPAREDEVLGGLTPDSPVALRGGDAGRRLVVAARLTRQGYAVV